MNLRTFIERPVFSAVISITIVILGIIGLFTLPVEQYPDIAPPTVMVSTTYYGASAETLQKSVIAPLEEVNPEKPYVPLNKNDAFQKVQKRRVQKKR